MRVLSCRVLAVIFLIKSLPNRSSLVFALRDSGGVISCWSVGDQPILTTVMKPSNLTSPDT